MSVKIHSDMVQLSQMLSGLEAKRDRLTETELVSIISKVAQKLKDLDSHSKKGFTPVTQVLRNDICTLLQKLDHELQTHQDSTSKINQVRDQILQVQKTVETAPLHNQKKIEKPKIELKIGFFCDLDCPDHNKAITTRMTLSIQQNLPFITTRSMIKGTGTVHSGINPFFVDNEDLLLENQSNWEIFVQNGGSGNEFLVFLPKSLQPEKSGIEKLKALDFTSDGSLQQVSVSDVFKEPSGKGNIEAFFKLFTTEPKIDKLFYIAGHGGSSMVAALEDYNYLKFLDFLEGQRCRGLSITSCDSGGESSLLSIPKQSKEEGVLSFKDQPLDRTFSVIVRSIGDFPTISGQEAEENLSGFYDELAAFAESPKPETLDRFRHFVDRLEGDKQKSSSNRIKVYFPHTSDSPGGFRSIGEKGIGFACTYNRLKQAEVAAAKSPLKGDFRGIRIKGKDFLEVYPMVVDVHLQITDVNPIVLSMIPGNSHHFVKSIELSAGSGQKFINSIIDFHKGSEINAKKAFFFGTIKSAPEVFKEVALFVSPTFCQCVYSLKGKFYWTDGSSTKEISSLQHAVLSQEIMRSTTPAPEAIRASSGGQESADDFSLAIHRNFWKKPVDEFKAFVLSEKIPTFTEIKNMLVRATVQEKESIIFHLLGLGLDKLALQLFKSEKLDPNMKQVNGLPIISYAISLNNLEMVEHLILEGAELNLKVRGSTVLHQAVQQGNSKIVELILLDPEIDIEAKNKSGWTPIVFALNKPEIFQMLMKRGASLDYFNTKKETPLSFCVANDWNDKVSTLLSAGADPNFGNPSPLVIAIRTCNLELVKQMLQHGGKAFEKDSGGSVPFIEALAKGPIEIVKLLIEQKDCNLSVEDNQEISPAMAALYSGNSEKIQLLKSRDARFPSFIKGFYNEGILSRYIKRSLALNDKEAIKELLFWNGSKSPHFEIKVVHYLLKHNISLLEELVQTGLINPSTTYDDTTIFSTICRTPEGQFNDYENLLDICIAKGADVNHKNRWEESLVEFASSSKNEILVKKLLEAGANLSLSKKPSEAFASIVSLNNLSLAQLAYQKCSKIETVDTTMALHEAAKLITKDSNDEIFKWLVKLDAKSLNTPIEETMLTPFCDVICSGKLELVEYCLAHGAQIELKGSKAYPPLMWASSAVKENDPEGIIYKKLISLGCDQNSTASNFPRSTPFAVLVRFASLPLVEWALNAGANPNPPNPYSLTTPLQGSAINAKDTEKQIFKKLVEAGANINEQGKLSEASPFVSIISTGKIELVKWCLAHGAKVSETLGQKDTPLQAASKLKDKDIAVFKLLLDNGANINDPGRTGILPIFNIIQNGDQDQVLFCLQKGARLETPEHQEQALLTALKTGKPEIIQILIDHGCKVDSQKLTTQVILDAFRVGKEPMLQKLSDMQVDFGKINDTVDELLSLIIEKDDTASAEWMITHLGSSDPTVIKRLEMNAIVSGKTSILGTLEQRGFPIDIKSLSDDALVNVIKGEHINVLQFLVQRGLDLNNKKIKNNSLLVVAFEESTFLPKKQVIGYILGAGADPHQCLDEIPLIYMAVEMFDTENAEILKLMLERCDKSEIYARNPKMNGENALELARRKGSPEVVTLIKEFVKAKG